VDMVSASRAYQLNVDLMNTTRQLMLRTLDLGK
jgi:flagellar basal-body rod protein FlgC